MLLQNMAAQMGQMGETLGSLVSRREHDALDKRVLALEEWRFAQTQREADRALGLQQQLANQQITTQREINQSQQDATRSQVSSNSRTVQILWGVIIFLGGLLASALFGVIGYIVANIPK